MYRAVEKMTAIPARRLRLETKGRLNAGADADITIFDLDTIKDGATFENPALPPQGIEYVFLAGEMVLKKGEILSDRRGKAVRK